jgi:hypothetical protein
MESWGRNSFTSLSEDYQWADIYKTHAHSKTLCKELYNTFHENLTNSLVADTVEYQYNEILGTSEINLL